MRQRGRKPRWITSSIICRILHIQRKPNLIIALLFIQNIFKLLREKMSSLFFPSPEMTLTRSQVFRSTVPNNLQRAALLPSSVQCDKIHSIFSQQQLVMVNYDCGFNQSQTGKYFEWIIIRITMFHASSVGLQYSLVCTCFSWPFSIKLVTNRERFICVSMIWLILQMIDHESLLMSISRPGLFLDELLLFISSGREELYWNNFVSYKK